MAIVEVGVCDICTVRAGSESATAAPSDLFPGLIVSASSWFPGGPRLNADPRGFQESKVA